MTAGKRRNRFQDFFDSIHYASLKNCLYNYRVRKWAIERELRKRNADRILEVGSGLSPVVTRFSRIVYLDLSFTALQTLKHRLGDGACVVADCTRLPFKSGAFSHTVCSEVLEHVPDDGAAVQELARVMRFSGELLLTFPHRQFYFAMDDRFVEHCRRYELDEMVTSLANAGLHPVMIRKVLGPFDKVTTLCIVSVILLCRGVREKRWANCQLPRIHILVTPFVWLANMICAWLAYVDAKIMPRALTSVLFIRAKK